MYTTYAESRERLAAIAAVETEKAEGERKVAEGERHKQCRATFMRIYEERRGDIAKHIDRFGEVYKLHPAVTFYLQQSTPEAYWAEVAKLCWIHPSGPARHEVAWLLVDMLKSILFAFKLQCRANVAAGRMTEERLNDYFGT